MLLDSKIKFAGSTLKIVQLPNRVLYDKNLLVFNFIKVKFQAYIIKFCETFEF